MGKCTGDCSITCFRHYMFVGHSNEIVAKGIRYHCIGVKTMAFIAAMRRCDYDKSVKIYQKFKKYIPAILKHELTYVPQYGKFVNLKHYRSTLDCIAEYDQDITIRSAAAAAAAMLKMELMFQSIQRCSAEYSASEYFKQELGNIPIHKSTGKYVSLIDNSHYPGSLIRLYAMIEKAPVVHTIFTRYMRVVSGEQSTFNVLSTLFPNCKDHLSSYALFMKSLNNKRDTE